MSDRDLPSVRDVAEAVLEKTGPIDTFKLQKLVYYCQAWHLVWAGEQLFPERIEAWANGPVIPALYRTHRRSFIIEHVLGGNPANLSASQQQTVASVVAAYRHLSGRQLARLTHAELPWQIARTGLAAGERGENEIPLEAMAEFYGGVDSDPDAELVERIEPEPTELD